MKLNPQLSVQVRKQLYLYKLILKKENLFKKCF